MSASPPGDIGSPHSGEASRDAYRFGLFELDVLAGELRKSGRAVKLQPQPLKVLTLLVVNHGALVTREALRSTVWGNDTFVDFDRGLNFCISQIRGALGDSADSPRFVETVPRRGYRFIAPVEGLSSADSATSLAGIHTEAPAQGVPRNQTAAAPDAPPEAGVRRDLRAPAIVTMAALLVLVAASLAVVVTEPTQANAARTAARAPDNILLGEGAKPPRNRDALDPYFKGLAARQRGGRADLERSVRFFAEAVQRDPGFAGAHAAEAESFHGLVMSGGASPHEAYPKAKAAAERALALDETSAGGHAALGAVRLWYDYDWTAAAAELGRAIQLNAGRAASWHDYAWSLVALQRNDEASEAIKRAQLLDPLSPRANNDIGWVHLRLRRYDDAVAACKRTLDLDPDSLDAQACLELAHGRMGRYDEARAAALLLLVHQGAAAATIDAITSAPAQTGLLEIARWRLQQLESRGRERAMSPYAMATALAALDRREDALQHLERALQDRSPMMSVVHVDPAFDGLRTLPAFADLLERVRARAPQ